MGGLLAVGVLFATGALDGNGAATNTTTVREVASTVTIADGSSESSTEVLYADAASGVVEIKATVAGGEAEVPMPFGEEGGSSESTATGSGFIVDTDGAVVTAAHVVDEATSVTVIFDDGTTREAEVLGVDDATDLAVIRVDASGLELEPLELGDSSELNVGASVAAIGAPFEYAWSLSTGIVSGLDRTIEAPNGFTVAHAIQTDAAVNPGNSGGPLLNSEGEVVGVVDQIATDGSADQSSGVGFAIPSNQVAAELEALEAGEEVEHAYFGVATGSSTGSITGAEVGEIVAGSPAAEAGVENGDVITSLGGTRIADSEDLVAAIAEHEPGDEVKLTVRRNSESVSLTTTLSAQPAESQPADAQFDRAP